LTTIAYKDGRMAADSKCTAGGMFVTKTTKMHRLPNGALLGSAGDADIRLLMDLLGRSTARKLPSRIELANTQTEFEGILAFPNGKTYLIDVYVNDFEEMSEWTAQVLELEERMAATGSGAQFALGAMAAGKSAAQAVAIACRYDSNSAPPVKEIDVKAPAKTKAATVRKRR
jgi:ATP-dependent protease HslVU (ClpYQ) peptidase subunit